MQTEIVPDVDRLGAYVVRVGGTDQSHVDLDDPTHLAFDYVRRIADVIDAVPVEGRARIVHVGGAGMTLARYVAATRPGTAQVVLEPDESLTELVRERLPLSRRSGIKVRPTDGRAGVAAMADAYADVVVVDAFTGAQVPADLVTQEALADVRRVLRPSGLVAMNVPDRAPFDWLGRVVAAAGAIFAEVMVAADPATLKGRRRGNVVLVASAQRVPWRELQQHLLTVPFPYRVLTPSQVRTRFASSRPFTDADTHASPAPPDGLTYFS